MKKYAVLFCLLFLAPMFGCSGNTAKVNWADPQIVLPLTENITQILTRQALVNQPDSTRNAVYALANFVDTVLVGQVSVSPDQLTQLVDEVAARFPTLPPNVAPLVKSILLVGLESVEAKLNQELVSVQQKNALLLQVAQAAVCGIIQGSTPVVSSQPAP